MAKQSFETQTLEQLEEILKLDGVRIKDTIFNKRKIFVNGTLAFEFRNFTYSRCTADGKYRYTEDQKYLYVGGQQMMFSLDKIMELYNLSEQVRISQSNKAYNSFLSGILNSVKKKTK